MEVKINKKETVLSLLENQFIKDKKPNSKITVNQLTKFIKDNLKFEENLIKEVYLDYPKYKEIFSSNKYFDNIFDKKIILPNLNTVVLIEYFSNNKKLKDIGCFLLNEQNEQNVVFRTINNQYINCSLILDWTYIDKELALPFSDIIESRKIIPRNDKNLVKRFCKVYKNFKELGYNFDILINNFSVDTIDSVLDLSLDKITKSYSYISIIDKYGTILIKDIQQFNINDIISRTKSNENDGRELFGINFLNREQDKITLESRFLTISDVIKLEKKYERLKNILPEKINTFNVFEYNFEYKERTLSIEKFIDLSNIGDNGFYSENKYFWFSNNIKLHDYEEVNGSDVIQCYKNNIDKFKSLNIDNILFRNSEVQKDYDYQLSISKGVIEKIDYKYFWDYNETKLYLRCIDFFDKPIYNYILASIIEYSYIGNNDDLEWLLTFYGIYNLDSQNLEQNFQIENIPVIKIGNNYFHYVYNKSKPNKSYCIQIFEDTNYFNFKNLKQPITIMLDEIINNNGYFTFMKLAVKIPLDNLFFIDKVKIRY